jgi:hypothetical protein
MRIAVCVLVLLSGCATAPPVAQEPPLTKHVCETLAGAAYRASSANDPSSAAIFMMVAKRGGCY